MTEENNIERRKKEKTADYNDTQNMWTSILSNHKVTSDTQDNIKTLLQ